MSALLPISDGSSHDLAASSSAQPEGWRDLVAKVGQEVALPLTAALDRVESLAETGRIDRQSLRTLRAEIERARRAAMVGQQLARLSVGDMQHTAEVLLLPTLFKDMLHLRQTDLQMAGLTVRPVMAPVQIHTDAALAFALLNACLDWTLPHAAEAIDVEMTPLASDVSAALGARLSWHFLRRTAGMPGQSPRAEGHVAESGGGDEPAESASLEDLNWVLFYQTAQVCGVQWSRSEDAGRMTLQLDFPAVPQEHATGQRPVTVREPEGSLYLAHKSDPAC